MKTHKKALTVYLLVVAATAIAAGVAGFFLPANIQPIVPCSLGAQSVGQMNLQCAAQNALPWLLKIVVVALCTIPSIIMTRSVMGYRRDADLVAQQCDQDGNDSPAILNLAGFLTATIVVTRLGISTPWNFLVIVAFKLALVSLVGLILAAILVRWRCGIKTIEEFQTQIDAPYTNAVALWIAAGYLLAAFLI